MAVEKIEIGKKYRVLPEFKGRCLNLRELNFDYIVFEDKVSYKAYKAGHIPGIASCSCCYVAEHLIPYVKTIETCERGDRLKAKDGSGYCKVIGRAGDVIFRTYSCKNVDEVKNNYTILIEHIKDTAGSFDICEEEPIPPETIEINGKKYDKAEVDKRLEELKPITE